MGRKLERCSDHQAILNWYLENATDLNEAGDSVGWIISNGAIRK